MSTALKHIGEYTCPPFAFCIILLSVYDYTQIILFVKEGRAGYGNKSNLKGVLLFPFPVFFCYVSTTIPFNQHGREGFAWLFSPINRSHSGIIPIIVHKVFSLTAYHRPEKNTNRAGKISPCPARNASLFQFPVSLVRIVFLRIPIRKFQHTVIHPDGFTCPFPFRRGILRQFL